MKKGLIFLLVLLVLVVGAIYLFIPSRLNVVREIALNANSFGIYRSLADQDAWNKWWPVRPDHPRLNDSVGQAGGPNNPSSKSNALPELGGFQFEVRNKLFKTLEVGLKGQSKDYSSGILFIPLEHDSSAIRWEVPIETGNNPINKISRYFEARKIANTLSTVLKSMKPYMEKEENLYKLSIKQGMVADTAFVSTRTVFNHFPTTDEVYVMIGKLHEHIAKQNGKENGYPMLNIDSSGINPAGGSGREYEVMVAIATDRILPESGDIKVKRMIQGNILIAEVTGGPLTIKEGMSQMHEYIRDHQRTAAAIPFQLLVTDRLKENDTSKWVTELRYPVF